MADDDPRSLKPAAATRGPEPVAESTAPPAPRDIVLVHSPTEDGKGARVLRVREQTIEAGEVRPLEEGKPIAGEIVKLTPRGEDARVCDVEVLVPSVQRAAPAPLPAAPSQAGALPAARKGPAQVATDDYRDNWGRIFGGKPPPSSLN